MVHGVFYFMRHNFSEELSVKANISFSIYYDPNVCTKEDAIKSLNLMSTNPACHIYFDEGSFTVSDPFAAAPPVRFSRKKVNSPPPFQAVQPPKSQEPEIEQVPIPKNENKLDGSTFKALENLS